MSRAHTAAQDAFDRLNSLLAAFAARAEGHDSDDVFVGKNFAEMKERRLMGLAVPAELGGGGVDLPDLATMLQAVARVCPSTSLAFSMHCQTVASLAWHWRQHKAPVDSILRRIAREQLTVATSNGSDWLQSSGVARRTKGGFRIEARKRIVSAGPASDLLATSAIYDDDIAGPTVLHFIVAMPAREVRIEPTWLAMGMRGTGSHHIAIKGLMISDRMVIARRPAGKWHPLYHAAVMLAMPLIFSVYLGIANAARDEAIQALKGRSLSPTKLAQIGAMDCHLNVVRIAVDDMLKAVTGTPDAQSTNRVFMARTLAGRAAIATVEAALELAGGAAFMRPHPIERMFRDVQAARFHPLDQQTQRILAGRVACGLDIDGH